MGIISGGGSGGGLPGVTVTGTAASGKALIATSSSAASWSFPSGTLLFGSTLGTAAASIDTGANGIAGGFSVLEIWIYARTTEAVALSTVLITFNNDATAVYDRQDVSGATGAASAAATTVAANNLALSCAGASLDAGAAGVLRLTVPGYAATTLQKTAEATLGVIDSTAANARVRAQICRYRSTSAISRMAVAAGSGNLVAGSGLYVYGRT